MFYWKIELLYPRFPAYSQLVFLLLATEKKTQSPLRETKDGGKIHVWTMAIKYSNEESKNFQRIFLALSSMHKTNAKISSMIINKPNGIPEQITEDITKLLPKWMKHMIKKL